MWIRVAVDIIKVADKTSDTITAGKKAVNFEGNVGTEPKLIMNLQNFGSKGTREAVEKIAKNSDEVANTSKKINYKKVFFDEYPDLEGKVVVHHGVEQ